MNTGEVFMINKNSIRTMIALVLIVIFSGCSSGNKESSFNTDMGRHAASNWANPDVHGSAAKTQPKGFISCQECHGNDFQGGITALSCFTCHGVNAPHAPAPWRGGTYTHTTTDPGNADLCALCHTNGANSSMQPLPPASAGTAPGCFNNTLCHAAAGHPVGWNSPSQHGVSAKAQPSVSGGFSLCQSCHGSDFTGGTTQTSCFTCHGVNAPHAPAPWLGGTYTHATTDPGNASVCALCHMNGANSSVQPSPPAPAGTAPGCFNNTLCHATPTCGSCHGIPPAGTISPDVAGKHAVHSSLATALICASCHSGAGTGTAKHQDGTVDVAFDALYNAKSGAGSFNATASTCSNVSCHGGQTTPSWLTGTINVNTQCTACHASGNAVGTPQYNSYYSGEHPKHSSYGCTECHDTTKLASVHFNDLNTTAMTQAYQTLLNTLNYTGTGGGTGTCTVTCHSENHNNRNW
jgi:predicted CxxxxCH...CXXCH cytochrome family protein